MTKPARQPAKPKAQRKPAGWAWRRGPMCQTNNAYQAFSKYRAKGKPT